MPVTYWVDAFNTAVYLINRLPTRVLKNSTPYAKLFDQHPSYEFLQIFGCACFPYLRPYNTNKLQFRSKRCVFIGYSLNQQGYRCLDPTTGRVYLSHHVVFDEHSFPFQHVAVTSSHSMVSIDSFMPLLDMVTIPSSPPVAHPLPPLPPNTLPNPPPTPSSFPIPTFEPE